ncbi:peptidase inhibitor 16-like [Tenrec ecaudatus]|uniref:peptidase inhibitor 16-like n=1 Tax=Tenrec ecaudatus TaxID=94439 RepID=UPI003F591664
MHSSHHLPLLLWLPLLMLLATSGTAGALTKEEKVLVVDAHNKYRSQTNPPAANMLRMNWDEKLASIATGYAKKCIWAHNPDRGRVGENLYAISGNGLDVQKATTDWYQELDFYNFTTGVCQQGKMCGHYTQVVWAKSEKIGCGSHLCPKLKNVPESNVHILVCNYAPPGNVVGEQLYEVGPPCSACPAGYPCEESLCGPSRGPEEPQDLPCPVTEAQTSLATETSGSSTLGAPLSLVTEAPSFLVTEGPVPLATKTLPAVQTEAPSSLVTKDLPSSGAKEAPSSLAMKSPLSMAMEATPSETTEVPAFGATHSLLSLFEKTVTIPISTQAPSPKSEDKGTGRTRAPSQSPERSLTPKMPLIGTPQPLLHAQKTGAVGPHQWAAPKLEEPNPQNIESLDQKMPEETVVEESKEENPDQGESYWDEPYEEEPDIDDINEDQFYEEDELKLTRQNPGIRKPTGPPDPNQQCLNPQGPPDPNQQCLNPQGPPDPNQQCLNPQGPPDPNQQDPNPQAGPPDPNQQDPNLQGPNPQAGPPDPNQQGPNPQAGPPDPSQQHPTLQPPTLQGPTLQLRNLQSQNLHCPKSVCQACQT